jgi:hypothetical protein
MATPQENMAFHQDRRVSPKYFPGDNIEHLSYLKMTPSIFKTEQDKKIEQMDLICAACDYPITKVSEKIAVRGRHDHAFHLYGDIVRLGCFREASGCMGVQGVSNGYSWFRGYAWQIQVCRKCFTQLGWKYMSLQDSFYGLMFHTLREETSEEKI